MQGLILEQGCFGVASGFHRQGRDAGCAFPQILSYETKLASHDAVVPDVHSASTVLTRYHDDLPSELEDVLIASLMDAGPRVFHAELGELARSVAADGALPEETAQRRAALEQMVSEFSLAFPLEYCHLDG